MKKSVIIAIAVLAVILAVLILGLCMLGGGEKRAVGITATAPDKTQYITGEVFDPSGIIVKLVYSDGSEETVADFSYAPTDALSVSDKEITIYYTTGDHSFTTTVSIQVTDSQVAWVEAPVVSVDGDEISWNAVSGATGYEVYYNDELVDTVTATSYRLNVGEGTYWIYVVAISGNGDNKISSDPSVKYLYVKESCLNAPVISLEGNEVSWNPVAKADGYEVYINGKSVGIQKETSYSLTETAVGTYSVKVVAKDSTNALADSLYSNEVIYLIRPDLTKAVYFHFNGKVLSMQSSYLVAAEALSGAGNNKNAAMLLEEAGNGYYYIRNTEGKYLVYVPASEVMHNRAWVFADKLEKGNDNFLWSFTEVDNSADAYHISNKGISAENQLMVDGSKVVVQQLSTSKLPASAGVIYVGQSNVSDFAAGQIQKATGFDMSKPFVAQFNSLKAENGYLGVKCDTWVLDKSTLENYVIERANYSKYADVQDILAQVFQFEKATDFAGLKLQGLYDGDGSDLFRIRTASGYYLGAAKGNYFVGDGAGDFVSASELDVQNLWQIWRVHKISNNEFMLQNMGNVYDWNNTESYLCNRNAEKYAAGFYNYNHEDAYFTLTLTNVDVAMDPVRYQDLSGKIFGVQNLANGHYLTMGSNLKCAENLYDVFTLEKVTVEGEVHAYRIRLKNGNYLTYLDWYRFSGEAKVEDVTSASGQGQIWVLNPVVGVQNGYTISPYFFGREDHGDGNSIYRMLFLDNGIHPELADGLVYSEYGKNEYRNYCQRVWIFEELEEVPDFVKLAAPEIKLEGNKVTWSAIPNAGGYEVYVNGILMETTDSTTYDLGDTKNVSVQVKAVSTQLGYISSDLSNKLSISFADLNKPFVMSFNTLREQGFYLGIVDGSKADPSIRIPNFLSEKVSFTGSEMNCVFALESATSFANYRVTGIYEGDGSDLYYIRTQDGRYLGAAKNNYVNSGWGDYVSASTFDSTNLWLVWKVTKVSDSEIRLQNLGHMYDWNAPLDYLCNLNRAEDGASTGFYGYNGDDPYFTLTLKNVEVTMQDKAYTDLDDKSFEIGSFADSNLLLSMGTGLQAIAGQKESFTFEKVDIGNEPNAYRIRLASGQYLTYTDWYLLNGTALVDDLNNAYGLGQVWVLNPVVGVENGYTISPYYFGKENHGDGNGIYRMLFLDNGIHAGLTDGTVYSEYGKNEHCNYLQRIWVLNEVAYVPAPVKLDAPVITLNGKVVSWSAVSNATGYEVYVNGSLADTTDATSYTITAAGDVAVQVKAVSALTGFITSDLSNELTTTIVDLTQPFVMSFNTLREQGLYLGIVDGSKADPTISIPNFLSEKVSFTGSEMNCVFALEPATSFANYRVTGIYEGDGSDLYYIRTQDGRYLGAAKNNYVNSGWGDYVSASTFDSTNLWLVWKVTKVSDSEIRLQNLGHMYDWNTNANYLCNLNRAEEGASTGFYGYNGDDPYFTLTFKNVAATMQSVAVPDLDGNTFEIRSFTGLNQYLSVSDSLKVAAGTKDTFTMEKVTVPGEDNAYRIRLANGQYLTYTDWYLLNGTALVDDLNNAYGLGQVWVLNPVVGVENGYTISPYYFGKENHGDGNGIYRMLFLDNGIHASLTDGTVYSEYGKNEHCNYLQRIWVFSTVA